MIKRLAIFLSLFVAISGVIGIWLIKTPLLYPFWFYLYANLGKMVILGSIFLGLLIRDNTRKLKINKWHLNHLKYLFLAIFLIPVFFICANLLLLQPSFESNLPLSIITHLTLILIPVNLLLGVFGYSFIAMFIRSFKRQLLICMGLGLILDLGIFQVWKLWPLFSGGVLSAVKFLLSLSFNVVHIRPFTLITEGFRVGILQACSGLDSIFMFTALYLFIAILDRRKLNLKRMLLMYPLAVFGVYLVNILRVYLLIVIGVLISPQIALSLFHTYAGMIFFLAYFAIYWKLTFTMIRRQNVK